MIVNGNLVNLVLCCLVCILQYYNRYPRNALEWMPAKPSRYSLPSFITGCRPHMPISHQHIPWHWYSLPIFVNCIRWSTHPCHSIFSPFPHIPLIFAFPRIVNAFACSFIVFGILTFFLIFGICHFRHVRRHTGSVVAILASSRRCRHFFLHATGCCFTPPHC